jgi:hypothetical protein
MAKYETSIKADFDGLLKFIEDGVMNGSDTASLEDKSDFVIGDARCSVRVFERYSFLGGNRLSMNITLFQKGDEDIKLSAITAGGSQALIFKVNTFGEKNFLRTLTDLLENSRYKTT